jgi:hypothetical protein
MDGAIMTITNKNSQVISKRLLKLILVTGLFLLFGSNAALAQFEGVITMKHIVAKDQSEDGAFELIITPQRMMVTGLDAVGGYQAMQNMSSSGILIRLDRRDFVFMNDEKTAIKISKGQLLAMQSMMKSMQAYTGEGSDTEIPDYTFKKTGRTRDINGYQTEEFTIVMEDQPDVSYHAWVTKALNINWGMLAEKWGEGSMSLFPNDVPLNKLIDNGGMPILLERKKNGQLTDWLECSSIDRRTVRANEVNLPSGVKIMSLQDMMMQGFGG